MLELATHTQGNTKTRAFVVGHSRSDLLQPCILLLRTRDWEENQLEVLGANVVTSSEVSKTPLDLNDLPAISTDAGKAGLRSRD
jgi:hypothetical protein